MYVYVVAVRNPALPADCQIHRARTGSCPGYHSSPESEGSLPVISRHIPPSISAFHRPSHIIASAPSSLLTLSLVPVHPPSWPVLEKAFEVPS